MGAIENCISCIKEILHPAAKLQQQQREQIQAVVGELADKLEASVNVSIHYLECFSSLKEKNERIDFLRFADKYLHKDLKEFDICGDLYKLKDRFKGLFDVLGASVELSTKEALVRLVEDLAGGERLLFDDWGEMVNGFRQKADELDVAQTEEAEDIVIKELEKDMSIYNENLMIQQKEIKVLAREIVDTL